MEKDAEKWKCSKEKCNEKAYVNINSAGKYEINYQYFCLKHFYSYSLYVVETLPLILEAIVERRDNPQKAD